MKPKSGNFLAWVGAIPVFFLVGGAIANAVISKAVDQSLNKSKTYTDQRIGQIENKLDIVIGKQQTIGEDVAFMRGNQEHGHR